MQKLGKNPKFGVQSEIQRAKFRVFLIYIFGGKIWGSNKNFRGKFWGQAPRPPNMEVPPGMLADFTFHVNLIPVRKFSVHLFRNKVQLKTNRLYFIISCADLPLYRVFGKRNLVVFVVPDIMYSSYMRKL